MIEQQRISDEEVYRLAIDGYLYELEMLIDIVHSNYFKDLLPIFAKYKKYISSNRRRQIGKMFIDDIQRTNKNAAISFPYDDKKLSACVNLAACCEIFSGWSIPTNALSKKHVAEYLQFAISEFDMDKRKIARLMSSRLNSGDACRVIQSLKLLGLLTINPGSCYQLSLGCSVGHRDRQAVHNIPIIRKTASIEHTQLEFEVSSEKPRNIVLVDNDPGLKQIYDHINMKEAGRVLALNEDIYDGLENLLNHVFVKTLNPRNLIIAFRLEPKALTDIQVFLKYLGGIIDERADFITSIGAGDDNPAFKHRLDVLDELNTGFLERGLKPVRLKWYKGKNLEEQRSTPIYGLPQYATFEILYCKLKKQNLSKR